MLLIVGLRNQQALSTSIRSLASNGIGHLNLNLLVYPFRDNSRHPTPLVAYVVLANTPQLILSLLYMTYNDLFTRMHLSKEWASYASDRKTLRTSQPRGLQRNTYFLSLPGRFSIPFLIAMILLPLAGIAKLLRRTG